MNPMFPKKGVKSFVKPIMSQSPRSPINRKEILENSISQQQIQGEQKSPAEPLKQKSPRPPIKLTSKFIAPIIKANLASPKV